jgi:hypothetical protein
MLLLGRVVAVNGRLALPANDVASSVPTVGITAAAPRDELLDAPG